MANTVRRYGLWAINNRRYGMRGRSKRRPYEGGHEARPYANSLANPRLLLPTPYSLAYAEQQIAISRERPVPAGDEQFQLIGETAQFLHF